MKQRWNARYGEEKSLYGEEPNEFLASVAGRFPAGGRLLGLAEGQGRNARFLEARGHPVVAVDSADVAVRQLAERSQVEDADIQAVEADLADYEPEPCAGVFAIYAHMPPPVRDRAYRRAWEALEPGGVFVLEAFTPDQLGRGTGGPPMLELLFGAAELRALLPEARFEILEEREVELDEGPLHRGLAAVVRMVAIKE
jgi:SAM-dependent methyltransferase